MSSEFTVRLEQVFQGPMDLLLHLVREQEVEIHEIEIAKVVDGFLAYLGGIESLDIELAGDFVVMAASLMAIKSRSLLPHEEVDLREELDPRDELIQRLIEYRRFRAASEDLGGRFLERSRLSSRGWRGEVKEHEEEPLLDLSEITAWDLLGDYSRLLRETGAQRAHRVALDPRPLRYYVETLVGRLRGARSASLGELLEAFSDAPPREALIGSFCALLELCKMGLVHVAQPEPGGDIAVSIREEHQSDIEEVVRATGLTGET